MKILYIEDEAGDVRLLKELLKDVKKPFNLFTAGSLAEGINRLTEKDIDVILLDLSLPDSTGLDTLRKVQVQSGQPSLPIVILTHYDDEETAVKAVEDGAQDYIIKGQFDGRLLFRVLRYAIQRHYLQEELRKLTIMDELTKLYNRQGFFHLAEREMKHAQRTKRKISLICLDLDGLKSINDTLGYQEGDIALIDVAGIIKNTFRSDDIVARIGGDEFVVLLLESTDAATAAGINLLQENIAEHNARRNRRFNLSLSWGISHCEQESQCSIDKLLSRAEELVYLHKIEKNKTKKDK
jgi:diguanylate cyclase (GGDEF)-like protein